MSQPELHACAVCATVYPHVSTYFYCKGHGRMDRTCKKCRCAGISAKRPKLPPRPPKPPKVVPMREPKHKPCTYEGPILTVWRTGAPPGYGKLASTPLSIQLNNAIFIPNQGVSQ